MRGSNVKVTLIKLGTVNSPYWERNPGSREHVPATSPFLLPELTTEEAAAAIVEAIEQGRESVVKPWFFKVLFWLNLGR
jgi:short-subunit dehydrogenase